MAWVTSHPIQYQAPLFRALAQVEGIDLEVIFLSDVSLRTYADPGFGRGIAWDINLTDGFAHQFLATEQEHVPTGFRPLALSLESRLAKGRYDVIVVNGYNKLSFLRAMIIGRTMRKVVLHRGESHLRSAERSPLRLALKAVWARALFAIPSAHLSIGTMNRLYYQHYGVTRDRIEDAPYGVDNAFFADRATGEHVQALKRSLGLDDNRVVLYASKLSSRKGPQHLIKAFAKLQDLPEFADVRLVIVGEGELLAALKAAAPEGTMFLGFQNQTAMPAIYALADVFVLPSRHEPWGLAVNEALSAGTPCIVGSEVGSALDLIVEGVTGFTVPFGDVDTLTRNLRQSLSQPWDAAEIQRHVAPFDATAVAGQVAHSIRARVAGRAPNRARVWDL